MQVIVRQNNLNRLTQFITNLLREKGHKHIPEEVIFQRVVTPYVKSFEKYCNSSLRTFLISEKWNKDVHINVGWEIASGNDTFYVNVHELEFCLKKNRPFLINAPLSNTYRKVFESIIEKGKGNLVTTFSGLAAEITYKMIHESTHIAQFLIKSESFIKATQKINLEEFKLSRTTKFVCRELSSFFQILVNLHKRNTNFLNMAKVEGEADYFGKMAGTYYSHGGSKDVLAWRRKDISTRVMDYLVKLGSVETLYEMLNKPNAY